MRITEHQGEIEISGVSDFNLVRIFECGQCFRWDADENGVYTGVAFGRVARLRSCGDSILISGSLADFEQVWRNYFDLDRDYEPIREQLSSDPFLKEAAEFGKGIRILRQDRWEALCSFIISQCNNIPRIKKIISVLCSEFGDPLEFENSRYFSFPSAKIIAQLSEKDLAPLRSGYRAEYIISAAKAISNGELDLDSLAQKSQKTAFAELKKLKGVGDKVANCVLLFGLNMLDAFPIDVWMKLAVKQHYGSGFNPERFHPYAGIAQQYIFYYIRSKQ